MKVTIKSIFTFCLMFIAVGLKSQSCTANFNYTVLTNGQVLVNSTSTGTGTNTVYNWNFSNGNPAVTTVTGSGGVVASTAFTASGVYTITLNIFNPISVCTSSIVQQVTVVITPTCAISTNTAAANFTNCNGSATLNVSNMCGPITYSWSNTFVGPIQSTMCPGNYTVFASGASGPTCCPSASAIISIPSVTPCNQSASFTQSLGLNGLVSFTSTSSGTTAATGYTWTFNGGTPASTVGIGSGGSQASSSFSTNGIYSVTLIISTNSPFCVDTVVQQVNVVVTPTCSITATTTAATFSNCNGFGSLGVSNMCAPVNFTWSNAFVGPAQGSLCPGTYTVFASGGTGPGCCPSASAIISIPSVTPCNLNASFTHSLGSNGLVNFVSTSTGTIPGVQYIWNFGDGSANGFGISSTHTYTAAGPFNAYLVVVNNSVAPCVDTSSFQLISPNFCNLTSSFTSNTLTSGAINFVSTSTGTSSTTQYSWNFGDGTTSTLTAAVHGYTSAGVYLVSLTLNDIFIVPCTSTFTNMVTINSVTCFLSSSFSHTVLNSGVVNFVSSSIGTNPTSKFLWDFGDSFTSILPAPSHTYLGAGTHFVKLRITNSEFPVCKDSITQAINITGIPCVANSGFTLFPSGTPQLWYATPNYPYNVTSAVWNWGDGNSSNGLYSSHVYSVSGNYSICLSVTVSCGANSTFCSSYFLSKPSGSPIGSGIYSVNIIAPSLKVGIDETPSLLTENIVLFPNPSNGKIYMQLHDIPKNLSVQIFDFTGKQIASFTDLEYYSGQNLELDLNDAGSGLYFAAISYNGMQTVKKFVIRKE